MAMNIMSTWWYPINGMNLVHPIEKEMAMAVCSSQSLVGSSRPPVRTDVTLKVHL